MSEKSERREEALEALRREKESKMMAFQKTFSGQASEAEARKTLQIIRNLCLADDCPAHAGGYETNRVMTMIGRQAIWREILAMMTPEENNE